MASQSQKIFDACTSGDVAALQQLFEANKIQNSGPVYRSSASGLHEYDPSVVSYEWDSHTDTFITKACEQPPKKITPLLLWLIEHDADLEEGHFPQPLCNAILGGQTLEVITAMINKNAKVSTLAMRQAVVCERIDVLNFFMGRGSRVKPDDAAYFRSEAEQAGNEEVIDTVKRWTNDKSCVVS